MEPNLPTEKPSVAAIKRHRVVCYEELFRSKRSKQTASADVSTGVKTEGAKASGLGFQIRGPNSLVSVNLGSDTNYGNNESTPNLCYEKGECENVIGDDERVADRGKYSNSQKKLVAKPSLRKKLFKKLGSHSFLPFLMDMAKDDTCSISVSPCIPKNEKFNMGTQDKGDHSDGLKALENEEMKNFGSELSHEAQNLDELNLSKIVEETRTHEDLKGSKDGDCSNGFDENIQKTPPQMNIFFNPEMIMVENEGNPKNKIVEGNDSFASENIHKDICLKNDTTFRSKMVLNPCSWGKIFKTPSSFSYRRLLPYMTNASNKNLNNSSDFSPHQTVTTDTEGNKTNTHLPVVDLNCQQNPIDKSETSQCSIGHSGSELSLNPPTAIPISDAGSFYIKQARISAEKNIELQKPLDSPNKCALPVEHVISNIINDLDHAYAGESSEIEMTSPPILSFPSGDNETRQKNDAQSNSSRGTKAPDLECLHQKSSQVEESIYFNSKGILRRNPLGCRGLCNCLSCTSFRLNADRAFEFSRNQMLDAEEVAWDLINELSSLRSLLKETSVNSHGQVTVDIDQVRKACTKALKAEESAKCRLKEMHSDLNVHCNRKLLERPCVKFSNQLPAGDRKQKE